MRLTEPYRAFHDLRPGDAHGALTLRAPVCLTTFPTDHDGLPPAMPFLQGWLAGGGLLSLDISKRAKKHKPFAKQNRVGVQSALIPAYARAVCLRSQDPPHAHHCTRCVPSSNGLVNRSYLDRGTVLQIRRPRSCQRRMCGTQVKFWRSAAFLASRFVLCST